MTSRDTEPIPIVTDGTSTDAAEIEEAEDLFGPLLERPEEPCTFVIFGVSGDLTARKLIPALYNLACQELLPPGFAVIGFAFTGMDDAGFRAKMREWVKSSPEVLIFREKLWEEFVSCLH